MKTSFTFAEASKVLAQVETVNAAVENFAQKHEAYREIDAEFDDMYEKCGYSFFRAPQELHDLWEKKTAAHDIDKKAKSKAFNAIKKFGELIGIGEGYPDSVEERVKRFLDSKSCLSAVEMLPRVQHLAIVAAKRIQA